MREQEATATVQRLQCLQLDGGADRSKQPRGDAPQRSSSSGGGGSSGGGVQPSAAAASVQSAFGDLLAMPSNLIVPADGASCSAEHEAALWDCFAAVYEQELSAQQAAGVQDVPKERKRQILADILVWAEITQSHYDSSTASFVTAPHGGDASFQRIGQLFKAAKQAKGLA